MREKSRRKEERAQRQRQTQTPSLPLTQEKLAALLASESAARALAEEELEKLRLKYDEAMKRIAELEVRVCTFGGRGGGYYSKEHSYARSHVHTHTKHNTHTHTRTHAHTRAHTGPPRSPPRKIR